VTRILVVI